MTITAEASATEPTPRTRPRLVLAICCMSLLIVGMDTTIVNVALPSIRRDLGASVSALQWTTAAYTVVLASLLMLGGSTADRLGRARVSSSASRCSLPHRWPAASRRGSSG